MKRFWMSLGLLSVLAMEVQANEMVKTIIRNSAKASMHSTERMSATRISESLSLAYDEFKVANGIYDSGAANLIGGPGVSGISVSVVVTKKNSATLRQMVHFDLQNINRPTRQQIKHLIESEREWIEEGQGFAQMYSGRNGVIHANGRDVDTITVEFIHSRPTRDYLNKMANLIDRVNRLSTRGTDTILSRKEISGSVR